VLIRTTIFTKDAMANRNVDVLRQFAKRQDIKYFYDVGTEHYKGVVTSPFQRKGTPGQAKCFSAPTATPAPRARSAVRHR